METDMETPTRPTGERAQRILNYWFSTLDDGASLDRETEPFRTCFMRWYGKDPAIDQEIRRLFEPDLLEVTRDGKHWQEHIAGWAQAQHGLLALLILLDQLPRNMYRGTAGMYQHDPLALSVATRAIHEYETASLSLVQRMFLYVPLMHIENLTVQQNMLQHFEQLVELAGIRSPQNLSFFKFANGYAKRHVDVIETFGRFPHRNAILGRRSTPLEEEYLKHEDAGF